MSQHDLPFTYERTYVTEEAQYTSWRISPVAVKGITNLPRTDEEILNRIRHYKENEAWYTTDLWRNKVPSQQLEITVGTDKLTLYNFNDNALTKEHYLKLENVLKLYGSKFLQTFKMVRWILIHDQQPPSILGDSENFPTSALAHKPWKSFEFFPYGLQFAPHRIKTVCNFSGVVAHELTHFIEEMFTPEWSQKFEWQYCWDRPGEWKPQPAPDGDGQKYFHVVTGEMSLQNQFALQPEQCVTIYARQNMNEDICDSMVAYLYDPELLQKVSPAKYRIIAGLDSFGPQPEVRIQEVSKDQIRLPTVEPETVKYYIHEP